ncbi:MAG: hypothetical protein ACYDAE_28275, partial [Steroidobacteraceae bacterium]
AAVDVHLVAVPWPTCLFPGIVEGVSKARAVASRDSLANYLLLLGALTYIEYITAPQDEY